MRSIAYRWIDMLKQISKISIVILAVVMIVTYSLSLPDARAKYALTNTGTGQVVLSFVSKVKTEVFIKSVSLAENNTDTSYSYDDLTLTSTVSGQKTLTVTFYNNSDSYYVCTGVDTKNEYQNTKNVAYTLEATTPRMIAGKGELTLNVTIGADNVTGARTSLPFLFTKFTEDKAACVITGTSSDNINTIFDDELKIDYTTTSKRWTTWSADGSSWGNPATLELVFSEEKNLSGLTIYQFFDTNTSITTSEGGKAPYYYGSCDEIKEISVEYYDDESGYVMVGTFTGTDNWTSKTREYGAFVQITADNQTYKLDATYRGNYTPQTKYQFENTITTSALKITVYPTDRYIVGLTGIVLQTADAES